MFRVFATDLAKQHLITNYHDGWAEEVVKRLGAATAHFYQVKTIAVPGGIDVLINRIEEGDLESIEYQNEMRSTIIPNNVATPTLSSN